MSFDCNRCGACCRNLIVPYRGWHLGIWLMPQETSLFPAEMVSPMWAVGTRGRSRPRPDIKSYQLNVKDCPHLTHRNLCRIYPRRPTVCQAAPLSLHVNPYTLEIESASVDSKCQQACTLVPEEGKYRNLKEIFPAEVLRANAVMARYLAWMFNVHFQKVWLYDLQVKAWKEVTAENVGGNEIAGRGEHAKEDRRG